MNKIDTGIAELLAMQPSDSAEKDAYIAELRKTVRLLSDEVRNMDRGSEYGRAARSAAQKTVWPIQ